MTGLPLTCSMTLGCPLPLPGPQSPHLRGELAK